MLSAVLKFCILAWMCTIGLFNVLSNYGFSLCGVFSHDVMAANDTGVPKQWNDAHVGVRIKTRKSFLLLKSIFYRCWSREWKRCILTLYIPPAIKRMYKRTFCYFFHVGAKAPPKCFIKPNFGYFPPYSTKFVVLAQIDVHFNLSWRISQTGT